MMTNIIALKAANAWNMFANDQYGDCVEAGAAHEHMLWTLEGGGQSAVGGNASGVLGSAVGGNGGQSCIGGRGPGGSLSAPGGASVANSGSGSGGAGAAGVCIITEYINL
jgi:hypothetical protein